jgi:hypothetical protein
LSVFGPPGEGAAALSRARQEIVAMMFALIGFYRDGIEDRLIEISDDVNEYLGQFFAPVQLAAVLRANDGTRIGNIVLIDAPTYDEAATRLRESPALKAGFYDRYELAKLDIEIGGVRQD